jgi:ribosomal-protein-alanine N-acetyltransferase
MTPEALAALSERAYRHMRPWTAAQFADTLNGPHTLLATSQHAFVLGRVVADEAEILALASDPASQRQGEASRALAHFHTMAYERGANRVFLEVAAANSGACAFYAAQGYTPSGMRQNYYAHADGSRDNAVIMTRALPLRQAVWQGAPAKTG